MNFEDLKVIWDEETSRPSYTFDADALHRIVLKKAQRFRSSILFRDYLEISIAAILFVQFLRGAIRSAAEDGSPFSLMSMALILMTIGVAFVGTFLFIGRQRQKQRDTAFEQSIEGNLQKLLANVSYQIRLLRNVAWWYLFPLVPGMVLFLIATADEGALEAGGRGLFFASVFGVIYWINQRGVRTHLLPQKRELETLLSKLEAEKTGE